MSEPFIKFWKSNWQSDMGLRRCSLAARGLWLELLLIMHDADERGYLAENGVALTVADIAKLVSSHAKTVDKMLLELRSKGVYSEDERGIIFSRKMVKDHAKALQDQQNGRKGGNPSLLQGVNPPPNPPDKGRDKLIVQSPEARGKKDSPVTVEGVPAREPAEAGTLTRQLYFETGGRLLAQAGEADPDRALEALLKHHHEKLAWAWAVIELLGKSRDKVAYWKPIRAGLTIEAPAKPVSMVFVQKGSPGWLAWSAARPLKPWPTTQHGSAFGWWFETEFPAVEASA